MKTVSLIFDVDIKGSDCNDFFEDAINQSVKFANELSRKFFDGRPVKDYAYAQFFMKYGKIFNISFVVNVTLIEAKAIIKDLDEFLEKENHTISFMGLNATIDKEAFSHCLDRFKARYKKALKDKGDNGPKYLAG